MTFMEGALWKWTNYMSGWQLRWFVLDVGVLSYYRSQDDIQLGSRGSVKMGCCEVSAQVHDPLRIDLKIPPDQYMYIKAATPAERQQWLVALGTAKACLTQGNTPHKPIQKMKNHDGVHAETQETLSEKMAEVHTCKDILVDQINAIKNLCKTKEDLHEFQEAVTLLSATCDTFLSDLSDCVRMAEQQLGTSSPLPSPTRGEPQQPRLKSPPRTHTTRKIELFAKDTNRSSTQSSPSSSGSQKSVSPVDENPQEQASLANHHLPLTPPSEQSPSIGSDKTQPKSEQLKKPTIFSTSPHRFIQVHVKDDGGIPTKSFLLACNSILPIFDVLGPTAFAPVKLDISGNIKKLTAKYEYDPETCSTLQSMISVEIHSNTCTAKNSATDALLWLKRALQFTNAFLEEINKGERELVVVASNAYSKTLRKYHGWMVRGVFAMAVKAVPYWRDFVKALGTTESGVASEPDVLIDIKEFSDTLGALIDRINEFYFKHKLDTDNTV